MISHHYANGLPLFAYAAGAAKLSAGPTMRRIPLGRARPVIGVLTHTLGLVASAREPLATLSRALLTFAASLDLSSEIEQRIAQTR